MPGRSGPTFIQKSRAKGAAEKATFHQLTGAGKSRILRKFFGLSAADEAAIFERVDLSMDRVLRQER